MTNEELKRELRAFAERAKDPTNTDEVRATAGSLFIVLAAIEAGEQIEFMKHSALYAAAFLRRAMAGRD